MDEISTELAQAREEIAKEERAKAVVALKAKLRERSSAAKVLANIDREIADLEQSIRDGSFVG